MSKIIFFGTPKHVVCVPEALKSCGHEVVAVVTQPPKPVGRKQIITPSPVSIWANENNVKVIDGDPKNIVEELRALNAELGVLEAYGRIVPQAILDSFPNGIINIHPSLLPKYRGSSPVQATILSGDKVTGITLIKLDSEMDHGPILYQEEAEVKNDDTLDSLQTRLFIRSAEILCDFIPKYLSDRVSDRVEPCQQDDESATYTWNTNETKQKAYFDITNPPPIEVIEQMIRAFYPWPIAWTEWRDKVIKLFPGGKIQIEGKNPVTYEEFKRVHPDFPLFLE